MEASDGVREEPGGRGVGGGPDAQGFRVLVTGPTLVRDYRSLWYLLDGLDRDVAAEGRTLTVVAGMAEGAELAGRNWALASGRPVEELGGDGVDLVVVASVYYDEHTELWHWPSGVPQDTPFWVVETPYER